MINKIWGIFIIIGIIYSLFTGNINIINNEIIECGKTVLNMTINLFPIMAIWLGIMKIAEDSGLLKKLSKILYPITKIIFPEIPKNNEVISLITTSFIFNMFGLGNASTPIGLKTMKKLKELSKNEKATNSMITFLVLNTTGFTIIPTTIISLRMMHNSINPSSIIFPCLLASLSSTIFGIIIDRFYRKRCQI